MQFIVQTLWTRSDIFNGIGKHTANDLLHLAAIHPFTPTWVVCEDDTLFSRFFNVLLSYTAQWTSDTFLTLVAGNINSNNPFSFHYNSNTHYIARYVMVYRKREATVPVKLANYLHTHGYLDIEHIIGVLTILFVV